MDLTTTFIDLIWYIQKRKSIMVLFKAVKVDDIQ